MKFYYADSQTADFLKTDSKKVYLYGGYGGYNNFGDIIQLKNTIAYHRNNTEFNPVIILQMSSLERANHVTEFKRWFNCENVLFVSDTLVDASEATLELVDQVSEGSILHVYGGGFLNRFWGHTTIDKIEDFVKTFGLSAYLFSGQQIDEEVIPELNALFESIGPPEVFGVRDKQSLESMEAASTLKGRVKFSFDDVTETFDLWRERTKPNLKVRLIKVLRPKQVMWHINTSSYATKSKYEIINKINKVKNRYPRKRILLAHIYNDIRYSLRDTLQSVVQMEDRFPYREYGVVNLAQMALDLQAEKGVYPAVGSVLSGVEIAVASSYHVTMFAHFFGIPAYLMSENEFYTQKQKGLGLETDFQKFLDSPGVNLRRYTREREARSAWINELNGHMSALSKRVPTKFSRIKINRDRTTEAVKVVYRNNNS